jgi:hypothetical protein
MGCSVEDEDQVLAKGFALVQAAFHGTNDDVIFYIGSMMASATVMTRGVRNLLLWLVVQAC